MKEHAGGGERKSGRSPMAQTEDTEALARGPAGGQGGSRSRREENVCPSMDYSTYCHQVHASYPHIPVEDDLWSGVRGGPFGGRYRSIVSGVSVPSVALL